MSGKAFIDTNILVYSVAEGEGKAAQARELILTNHPVTLSTQVINEFLSVTTRKNILPRELSFSHAREFMNALCCVAVETTTIEHALQLLEAHSLSLWDSLIVASALDAGCDILYTEDLQHGQIIEDQLTIINPFS
jgi:predicted nucleic acid-binding protein